MQKKKKRKKRQLLGRWLKKMVKREVERQEVIAG